MNSSPRYTWVITRDLLHERDPDTHKGNEVGKAGPHNATSESINKARESGMTFRMFDGDDNAIYEGRIWHRNGPEHCDFQPLDDFGEGNAGCTDIRYLDEKRGTWTMM